MLDEESIIFELQKARTNGHNKKELSLMFDLGVCYFEKDRLDKSKECFKNILKKDKKFKKVNYYLSLIEIKKEKISKAIDYIDLELEINSKDKETLTLKEKLIIHSNLPLVTITLVLLMSIVYFFTYPELSFISTIKFALNSSNVNYFNAVTSLFFHINLVHFIFNILMLTIFGLYLEKYVGSLNFLLIFMFSGIIGNIIQAYTLADAFILGASTGIFGIIGAIAMREPLMDLKVLGFFKVPMIIFFGLFFLFENLISYFTTNYLVFGNLAHIMGFLFGILITGTIYRETIEIFYNWLGIAVGFLAILFVSREISSLISFFQISQLFIVVVGLLIGIFLIFYSYEKLKLIKNEGVRR